MAIEIVEKEQAELKGQFDQFDKRVERMQTDVDNTKSELTLGICDPKFEPFIRLIYAKDQP